MIQSYTDIFIHMKAENLAPRQTWNTRELVESFKLRGPRGKNHSHFITSLS